MPQIPPPVWSSEWWSTFTTSPAMAGVAAVVAALIALASAGWRASVERRMAREAHTRTQQAAELVRIATVEDRDFAAWWEEYQWTYDRLATLEPDDAVRVLGALGRTAPTPIAVGLVDVALTAYTSRGRARKKGWWR